MTTPRDKDKGDSSNLYHLDQSKRTANPSAVPYLSMRQSKAFYYFNTLQSLIHQATGSAKKYSELLLITDAGLQATGSCLDRMKAIAEQAADNKMNDSKRLGLQREINLLRAQIDRIAYNTNESIRHKLGLPPIKGYFAAFDPDDPADVSAEYRQDQFNSARFVYDAASDQEFDDYIGNLPDQEYDETLDEIFKALILMRSGQLGVDGLDVINAEQGNEID